MKKTRVIRADSAPEAAGKAVEMMMNEHLEVVDLVAALENPPGVTPGNEEASPPAAPATSAARLVGKYGFPPCPLIHRKRPDGSWWINKTDGKLRVISHGQKDGRAWAAKMWAKWMAEGGSPDGDVPGARKSGASGAERSGAKRRGASVLPGSTPERPGGGGPAGAVPGVPPPPGAPPVVDTFGAICTLKGMETVSKLAQDPSAIPDDGLKAEIAEIWRDIGDVEIGPEAKLATVLAFWFFNVWSAPKARENLKKNGPAAIAALMPQRPTVVENEELAEAA